MAATDRPAGAARRIATSVVWTFGLRIAAQAVGLLATMLVSESLGPAGFGEYTAALTWILFCGALLELGIDAVVVRDASRNDSEASGILTRGVGLKLLLAGLATLLAALSALAASALGWLPETTASLVLVGAPTLLVSFNIPAARLCLDWRFQLGHALNFPAAAALLQKWVLLGAVWALVHHAVPSASAMLIALIASEVVGTVVLAAAHARRFGLPRPALDGAFARAVLRQSWPLGIAGLLVLVSQRIAVMTVPDPHEAGYYSLTLVLAGALTMLPAVVTVAVYPMLAGAHGAADGRYAPIIATASRAIFALIVPAAAYVAVDGGRIAVFLGGPAFGPAGPALGVMVAGTAALHALMVMQTSLMAAGQMRRVLVAFATQSVLTVAALPAAFALAGSAPGDQAFAASLVSAGSALLGLAPAFGSAEGRVALRAIARAALRPAIAGSATAAALALSPAEWIASDGSRVWLGVDLAARALAGAAAVVAVLLATGGITRRDLSLVSGSSSRS